MAEQTANGSDELFEASDFKEQADETPTEPTVEASDEESANPTENQEEEVAANGEPTGSEAQTADPINDFLATKGIKTDDPEALRKVAEMYQNAEKGFYDKSQRAAQLERQLREVQALRNSPDAAGAPEMTALNEVRKLRTEMSVKEWMTNKNLSPEAEQRMLEWCSQPMTDALGNIVRDANGNPIAKGVNFLSGQLSLDDIYRLSGADTVGVDNLKEQMRAEARKEMIARQNAKRPAANATDSAQFGKAPEKDEFLEGLFG